MIVAIGLLILGACLFVLWRSPRTLSLREEKRLLLEYFRKIDRGEK